MIKLQESVLAVTRNSPLSAGVTSFLQDEYSDQPPLGGILSDARFGWLASGPKLCVVDLKTGQKVAARTFGAALSLGTRVTCVRELPTPLADNTRQLLVALACEDAGGLICVFHCNGSQVLRCIQTQAVVTELTVVERVPDGPLACCDGLVAAGTRHGQLFVFDLNRAGLIEALKNTSQGYGDLVRNEHNMTNLAFLSLDDIGLAEEQREIALESDDHLAVNLNEQSHSDGEYVLRNPDGGVRMKAKLGHVVVSTLLYVPQLGSAIVGYNFGGFQIWNLRRMCLEYTSPVNVECLPVTHFGFQEPCDDPRAFCYLWVTYSASDRAEDEACPLAIMYSLTYQGKRILSETQCLYQDFISCTSRLVLELACVEECGLGPAAGGRGVACHTYSVPSSLHGDGDEGVLNICQLVWESWRANPNSPVQYTMLLFDLDQWYKDQMPERWPLQNSTFMCVMSLDAACDRRACVLRDVRLLTATLAPYTHVRRLEEHFYPNSLQYSCICLTSEDASLLWTAGVQRQLISGMDEVGPTVLLHPEQLYRQCVAAGLTPLYGDTYLNNPDVMEQRKFLLSVALEGRLSQLLKKCARDWASGSHSGAGCTLQLFVEWCWSRALVLKRNARDLTAPLLEHSGVAPDRNVLRCLEHCVRQLTLLAGLLDAVVTKCCNLVVPDALSDMEERCKAIGMVATYFRVVQWFLSVGLLPEFSVHQEPHMLHNGDQRLPYPIDALNTLYQKRRIKLCCLDGKTTPEEKPAGRSCALLYIDQLIERECGGELVHNLWRLSGESESGGVYPPPSLHALLRVYLLPDVPDQHKHSLVLYLLMDFSATFSDVRYEAVTRRLMQFPTMFGLSNTAIKATQAFWHLDHRNFDFALDQLQCLTGNTLTDWQHSVVLSALLAQKKTQAALQYIHVRKPPPVQAVLNDSQQSPHERTTRRMDNDKLEDWQSCCDLYLARQLLFEAMDVVRLCVQSMASVAEKAEVLNFFFRGCKKTGQLSKILQLTLLPFEEEMFVKYLQSSGDRQCADILVMYYVQQARYLEAQRYNSKLKQSTQQSKEALFGSMDSLVDTERDRDAVRDTLVELVCTALPRITDKVAASMSGSLDATPKVVKAKPMSVFVQAKSTQNEFVYKSSFLQNTIENASETWVRRPQTARGLKRALHIEDTPFICTPKLSRTSRSIFSHSGDTSEMSIDEGTPPKRARLDTSVGTPKPVPSAGRMSARLSRDVLSMLEIPDVERVPDWKIHSADHMERSVREATPQSILKVRRLLDREQPSPVDSHYLGDTDDELETTSRHSNHTHCSDKHLRFAIPSSSNSATPSPDAQQGADKPEADIPPTATAIDQHDGPESGDSVSRDSVIRGRIESPMKIIHEGSSTQKKSYKDNVRARLSHSISANSSLNDDQHSSIESIADIPVMIINPRYSGESSRTAGSDKMEVEPTSKDSGRIATDDTTVGRSLSDDERDDSVMSIRSNFTSTPRTPRSRPSIRSRGVGVDSPASTRILRSRSRTPERVDMLSPGLLAVSSPRPQRNRSRSKTPDLKNKSPKGSPRLDPIPEAPILEHNSNEETSSRKILRTPEKDDSPMVEVLSDTSDVVEVLSDSPQKDLDAADSSPLRSQRSRSTTPEVQSPKVIASTSRTLRGRSKTPERESKLGSPKLIGVDRPKQKPLSRLVLEANTFTKINKPKVTKNTDEEVPISSSNNARAESPNNKSVLEDPSDSVIECTPMKDINIGTKPMADYEFSPIDKSVFSGSPISILSNTPETTDISFADLITPKTGTPFSTTYLDKSVLGGYRSSSVDNSESNSPTEMNVERPVQKRLEYSASPIDPLANESVLRDDSIEVSATIDNSALTDDLDEPSASYDQENITDDKNIEVAEVELQEGPSTKDIQEEKQKIVEIEREINEIEGQIEGNSDLESDNSDNNSEVEEDEDSGQVSDESDPVEGEESEDDESDSGKDSDDEINESSNDEANKALCVENSEVISLEDSSDDEIGFPPKRQRLSSSSDTSSSVALQIDVESDIDVDNEEESNSRGKSENELERNIASNIDLDTSFSESLKDGMLDKEQDPFLKPLSDKGNQSDTEVVLKPIEAPIIHQEESNSAIDAFNDGNYSLMTDDSSVLNTDRSEIDGTVAETVEVEQKEDETIEVKVTEAIKVVVEIESMDVVDNRAIIAEETENNKSDHPSTTKAESEKDKNTEQMEISDEQIETGTKKPPPREQATSVISDLSNKYDEEIKVSDMSKDTDIANSKVSKRRASINSNEPDEVTTSKPPTASAKSNQSNDNNMPKTPTRRQSKDKLEEVMPIEEPKEAESIETPRISERRTSAKSNQSDDNIMPKLPTRRHSQDKSEAKMPIEELKEAEPVSTARISKRRASALSNQSGDNAVLKMTTRSHSKDKSVAEMPTEDMKEAESVLTPRTSKRLASATSDEVTTPKTPTRRHSKDKSIAEMPTEELKEAESVLTPRTSKRLASATSDEVTTPKTPTRRHSKDKSVAKIPTEELKEAESVSTPRTSKRLASSVSDEVTTLKTPTRRQPKDKPEAETPLRRSARRVSKQSEEDNSSIISASSVKSAQSKGSKSDSAKVTGRKLRKSILMNTKPDLSVIPEVDDSAIKPEDASQMIQDYSASRRLTRHQRSLLEKSMEPPGAGAVRVPRRASVASSTASVAGSEPSLESESVESDLFGVQPIDPISLLSKKDFEGPRDLEELYVEEDFGASPCAVKPRSLRKTRAASETGSIKELRESRRMSMDLERVSSPVPSLDVSLPGSPSRPRRSSFNKALEALATPKRARRSSTDVREGDTDSLPGSPQPHTSKDVEVNVTPSRRTRRNSSVQSDATPAAPSPAKRTRKNSSIAEAAGDRETNN